MFLLKRLSSKKLSPLPIWKLAGAVSLLVIACLFALSELGSFQLLEWIVLDKYFRLRPIEETDSRLLIVTVDEPDLSSLRQWPLSDEKLFQVLKTIDQLEPRIIALDLYRDFPVPPGEDDLADFLRTTPNVIGVESLGGTPVPPPPVLADQGRVGIADIVIDGDGTVRRALLSVNDRGKPKWNLGAAAALEYLKQEGIIIDPNEPTELRLSTGVSYPRLQPRDGGYTRADHRGYQILLNYRGSDNAFETISIQDILAGRVPENLIRDRIVFIGVIAPSLNDFVYSPFHHSDLTGTGETPGVAIHAHIASQILSTALDSRPLIRSWSSTAEWLWAFLWVALASCVVLITNQPGRNLLVNSSVTAFSVLGLMVGVLISNGILFFCFGWWVPSLPSLLGIIFSVTLCRMTNSLKLSQDAYVDGLTEVLNRRAFDLRIADMQQQTNAISIILCDIDHFKGYNDFYGHPGGDRCLKQVAQAMQKAVRPQDLVARYGGEEFAVILQNTSEQKAYEVAERVRETVQELRILHEASSVGLYVSMSCGVATRSPHDQSPISEIILQADKALYESKRAGRNRVTLYQASSLKDLDQSN